MNDQSPFGEPILIVGTRDLTQDERNAIMRLDAALLAHQPRIEPCFEECARHWLGDDPLPEDAEANREALVRGLSKALQDAAHAWQGPV